MKWLAAIPNIFSGFSAAQHEHPNCGMKQWFMDFRCSLKEISYCLSPTSARAAGFWSGKQVEEEECGAESLDMLPPSKTDGSGEECAESGDGGDEQLVERQLGLLQRGFGMAFWSMRG